jgi:Chromatin modification-related protein EAF7
MIDVPQAPWTYDSETALFRAIISHRPIGLHKSLQLLSILNSINAQSDIPITLTHLKSKLEELYNVQGLEEQESSDTEDESSVQEFQFPYEDCMALIEARGKGIEGDGSPPAASPEAATSVRSASLRGTKRLREESTVTSLATDEEPSPPAPPSPTVRTKRPRPTQRKVSASATPSVSTVGKKRTRQAKESEEPEEEGEEEGSVGETVSVTETDAAPSKVLRTSSRRRGQEEVQKGQKGRARATGRARARGRTKGH